MPDLYCANDNVVIDQGHKQKSFFPRDFVISFQIRHLLKTQIITSLKTTSSKICNIYLLSHERKTETKNNLKAPLQPARALFLLASIFTTHKMATIKRPQKDASTKHAGSKGHSKTYPGQISVIFQKKLFFCGSSGTYIIISEDVFSNCNITSRYNIANDTDRILDTA